MPSVRVEKEPFEGRRFESDCICAMVLSRKKKVIHRTNPTDDKRLQTILKRLGVNHIAGIEEVNMFMKNSQVMHFEKPKGKASDSAS